MHLALLFIGLFAIFSANSQTSNVLDKSGQMPIEQTASLNDWLMRWNEASKRRAYTGTFVVSTPQAISSAKIWHVCDGQQQLERVDTLTGPARTTIRRNEEVVTFVPETKLSVLEKREGLSLFPSILQSSTPTLGDHYSLKPLSWIERVAGFEADVIELIARDDLRFSYRIWSEKKTGLILKLQTIDAQSRVLEQVAFSELQLDAPVRLNDLVRAMRQRSGYSAQKLDLIRTSPQVQGWQFKKPISGFNTVACHFRVPQGTSDATQHPLQWVLSDGLASVSAFIETFDAGRHTQEAQMAVGSTHSLSRRHGNHWITWVGEVPFKTLLLFATSLERIQSTP
jgi:sigma-E factor negative regulatory protein RseB